MYKKLLKNSAIYGVIPQLPKVASFFVLPLITPYLTGVDYGIVGVLGAYIGALSAFQLLGFQVVVTNAFYRHPGQYKWFWRQAFGFLWLWSVLFAGLLSIVIYFTLPAEAHEHRWLIIGMKVAPLLLFGISDMLASTYYRLNHKALPIATRSLFAGVLGIGLNFYFIAILRWGYLGWITSEFITAIVSGILFFFPVYRRWGITPIFNFKTRLIKQALKVSLPVIPHAYGAYLLNSSDRAIMELLKVGTRQIGLYSLAYNFGTYINTITLAINQAVGPNLIELIKQNRWGEYERIILLFQASMIAICFTLALWIPQWLPLLIRNEELQQITYMLVVIIMSYSFKPLYIGCNQVVFYFEKTNILWRITLVAGIINIVLNLITVPFFGIYAAAVNTLISNLYMALAGFRFNHFKSHNKAELYPGFWLGFIIAASAAALVFLSANVVVKLVVQLVSVALLLSCVWMLLGKSKVRSGLQLVAK